VPKPGAAAVSDQDVIAYCAKHLAGFKKPKRVVFVNSLPRTPSHKIIKSELRERYKG